MVVAITGREAELEPTDAVGALAEFYRAFNSRSFELMELNWIGDDDASMLSPFGGVHRGWTAISQIYERLLRGKGILTLELHDYTIHQIGETFLAIGEERARYERDGTVLQVTIRTSRAFKKKYGRWRQYHHHGSIDEPSRLAGFQSAVNTDPMRVFASDGGAFGQSSPLLRGDFGCPEWVCSPRFGIVVLQSNVSEP